MDNYSIYSTMVRSGKVTYFIDVRESKNGKKYMSVSETSMNGEERKRITLRIFSESIDQFKQAINEAASTVTQ